MSKIFYPIFQFIGCCIISIEFKTLDPDNFSIHLRFMMYIAYTFGLSIIFSYHWLITIVSCIMINLIFIFVLKTHFVQVPNDFIITFVVVLCVMFSCMLMIEKFKRNMFHMYKRTQALESKVRDILKFIPDPVIKVNLKVREILFHNEPFSQMI